MYIIGENIHIISEKVKGSPGRRDREFFQELAREQVEAGAQALDINLGPRKKDWRRGLPLDGGSMSNSVVDVPLSFDTTNLAGIEAGLKTITKAQPIINSTSAEPERLERVPLIAKKYNTRLVALTMGASGIPVAADERVSIAVEAADPAHDGNRLPDGRPDHRPAGADRLRLPGVLPAADRNCAHPAVCLGPLPCHFDRALECLQCGAQRRPPADQPGLPGDADGRGSEDDDRQPVRSGP